MAKGTSPNREPWPFLHCKSNHVLLKLFVAAILVGFLSHRFFGRWTSCLPFQFNIIYEEVSTPRPPPQAEAKSLKNAEAHVDAMDGEPQRDTSAPLVDQDAMINQWRVTREHCDMYKGQWVYDQSYPPYDVSGCPYLRQEFDCLKYGRPDNTYLKYRWKPHGCELPRFDGKDFLSRWRGKKIMFVGDSLSSNGWVSLVCMLHAAVPNVMTSMRRRRGRVTIVRFKDYEFEMMYHNKPYIVDIMDEKIGHVLKLDSLPSNGTLWNGVDLLVFNTWYWWFRRGASQPFDYIQHGDKILKDMDRTVAFAEALNTWAKWVDSSIDPSKTTVVYQGPSPAHYYGREWGQGDKANCLGQKHPMMGSTYPTGPLPPQSIVKGVLSTISKPVHLLDITLLSQLRKDGHPSIYNGFHHMDCGHWCVGGVPDTWNQLLYAALV